MFRLEIYSAMNYCRLLWVQYLGISSRFSSLQIYPPWTVALASILLGKLLTYLPSRFKVQQQYTLFEPAQRLLTNEIVQYTLLEMALHLLTNEIVQYTLLETALHLLTNEILKYTLLVPVPNFTCIIELILLWVYSGLVVEIISIYSIMLILIVTMELCMFLLIYFLEHLQDLKKR